MEKLGLGILLLTAIAMVLFAFGSAKVAQKYDDESDEEFRKWLNRQKDEK